MEVFTIKGLAKKKKKMTGSLKLEICSVQPGKGLSHTGELESWEG